MMRQRETDGELGVSETKSKPRSAVQTEEGMTMRAKKSTAGFEECADLISDQKYSYALQSFKHAVGRLVESKSFPNRSRVARQLLEVATALEETLKKAYGDGWDEHIPKFVEEAQSSSCSFCGKEQHEVKKLVAGLSVFICDECVELCSGIIAEEGGRDTDGAPGATLSDGNSKGERLCGICMEPRETDELVFLPHAAYLCATCLDEIQTVRDKQTGK